MNRLIGKKVCDNRLGEGVVTKVEDAAKGVYITVEFPDNLTKKYSIPNAFGKSLQYADDEIARILESLMKAKEVAIQKAEQDRQAAELEKNKKTSRVFEDSGNQKIAEIDWHKTFEGRTNRVFKVHQGQSFKEEFDGRYVWAPDDEFHYHRRMNEIQPGDIIFNYYQGAVVAVSEAMSDCFKYPRPAELDGHGWGRIGLRVELKYHLLNSPFSLDPYKADIIRDRAGRYSSFDINVEACQGYMFELESELAKLFANEMLKDTSLPTDVIAVLKRI